MEATDAWGSYLSYLIAESRFHTLKYVVLDFVPPTKVPDGQKVQIQAYGGIWNMGVFNNDY